MAKKVIISLIITILLSVIFYNYAAKNYSGTKVIADYTSDSLDVQQINNVKKFPSVATSYTLNHMKVMIIIDILFALIYTIVMYRTKTFNKKLDILFSLFMIVLPLTLPFLTMYLSLTYTV
jgi:ABC-type uncharacterized transport system permease subunit